MSGVAIQDYVEGAEPELQDPTDPYEQVEKQFMDKLARLITHSEEALQAGKADVDSDEFYDYRGNFLDLLSDPQVTAWLQQMRIVRRAPFRKFTVKDEPENAEPI